MEQKCILAVFAHPDDESFGVGGVLRTAADEGVRTALICATRGEAGEISDPSLATPETLAQVREQELRDACEILGISDLTFLDYHDGKLAEAPREEAIERIVRQIRRIRPQVIITFDANGGYGHLDHIAIHHLTTEAFRQAGDPACYPAQLAEGLQPYAPQRLYYTANPRSVMLSLRDALAANGAAYSPGGNAATIPVEQMGTADELITAVVPLSERAYQAKIAAWMAHRTQNDPRSPINSLPDELQRLLRGTERFVQALPPGAPGGSEHDLFEGVRL